MKNFEQNTETKTTAGERTNRQIQFERLLEATSTAREIKARMVQDAPTMKAAHYYKSLPINHYILNYVYMAEGITEFKKFYEWKREGASVKKGAKAYAIWGQPVGVQKEERAEAKGEHYEATDEENQRFPMCYVFSNLQVRSAQEEERGGESC